MSDVEEGPPLGSTAMDEALDGPDKPSYGSNSAARHSPEPSNRSSRDEEAVHQQLVELRALNEKHAQIISLLRERFNIPVDISETASRLLRNVQDGWRRIDQGPSSVRDSAEGLLLQILPCGTHFMGLNRSGLTWSKEEVGFVESEEDTMDLLQKVLQEAKEVFRRVMNEDLFSTWRPVILVNGKATTDPEKCVWPINWDFLLERRLRSERCWSFFAAIPPGNSGEDIAFGVNPILLAIDDEVHRTVFYCLSLPILHSKLTISFALLM